MVLWDRLPTSCKFRGIPSFQCRRYLICSFITLILDSVGRKKPLMFGAASFVVTFSILAAVVASFPPGVGTNEGLIYFMNKTFIAHAICGSAAQKAGLAMIFLTSIFFSLSFGPVSWVLASEVRPTIHQYFPIVNY